MGSDYLIKTKSDFLFNLNQFKDFILSSIRKPIYIIFDPTKKIFGLSAEGKIVSEQKPKHTDSFSLIGILSSLYPEWLGDRLFQETHNLRFSYVGGAMARGIASSEMVIELVKCGMLGFPVIADLKKKLFVESGLSTEGKKLLNGVDMTDVIMTPSTDMFELGGKVQVLKKGTLMVISFMNYTIDIIRLKISRIKYKKILIFF